MKDELITSPLTGIEQSCYVLPINEKFNAYKCLVTGFETNDLMVEGEFDFEKLESSLPELYKDIKITDPLKRVWYPQVVNVVDKGIVFITGSDKLNWSWAAIKSIPVPEEEKERFKHPKTGEYINYKNDPTSLKSFDKLEFVEALDYIEVL